MLVTGMEELSKSRCRIFLDEEFAFVLYKGELRLYGVRRGEELSEENYKKIMEELLPKRAKLRAMNLLRSKDYTSAKLREKLKMGGYPDSVIEEALSYVEGYHYIDDDRYASGFIKDHVERLSRLQINQKLMQRGLSKEVVERAWDDWEAEGGVLSEEKQIQELCRKKHYDPESADEGEKRRMYGFLIRRGFSADAVRRAIMGG